MQIQSIPIGDIRPGPNDRTEFEEGALRELADDIRARGLLYEPIVRRVPDHLGEPLPGWEIVAGERRCRAVALLGWESVPCKVADLTDEEAAGDMLAENLMRRDLPPMGLARAFRTRMERFGWSVAETATRSHCSPDLVKRRLLLLALCPEASLLVARGSLPLGHAELLAGLDSNRQMVALRLFSASRPPTLEEFRGFCGELRAAQEQESMFDMADFALAALETGGALPTTKAAAVALEAAQRLPAPEVGADAESTLEAYLRTLEANGEAGAALVVSNLLEALRTAPAAEPEPTPEPEVAPAPAPARVRRPRLPRRNGLQVAPPFGVWM